MVPGWPRRSSLYVPSTSLQVTKFLRRHLKQSLILLTEYSAPGCAVASCVARVGSDALSASDGHSREDVRRHANCGSLTIPDESMHFPRSKGRMKRRTLDEGLTEWIFSG